MTNTDIYAILSSKPHNEHYLKRYWKFIQLCIDSNKNLSANDYTERHHICPKADDLFPEYKSFIDHKWNIVKLTARQHVVAHLILWKAYGKSQAIAFKYFFLQNSKLGDSYLPQREIPTCIESRYAAKVREECRRDREGFGIFKDSSGNKYFIKTDDPLIQELSLVGNNAGLIHTEESRQRIKEGVRHKCMVRLYFLYYTVNVRDLSDEFHEYLCQGWSTHDPEYDEWDRERSRLAVLGRIEKAKQANTGTIGYYYPDGTLYGRISHADPAIQQLGLVHMRSEKQSSQARDNQIKIAKDPEVQAKKSRSMSRLTWFYDPVTLEKGRFQNAPDGWLPGRKGTHTVGGTVTWNDGVTNYRVKSGDAIQSHWVKGMAPQKARESYYSNGIDSVLLKKGQAIPAGYYRAKKPKSVL
jgi:hypothetical protein